VVGRVNFLPNIATSPHHGIRTTTLYRIHFALCLLSYLLPCLLSSTLRAAELTVLPDRLELTGQDPSHGVIVSFIDAQGQVSDVTRRVTFEVDLSPDGSVVACGAANGEVRIFKMENGQRIAQIKSEQGPVFAIAFSSDGARIATGGYDGRIRLYNAANGEAIQGFASVPVP